MTDADRSLVAGQKAHGFLVRAVTPVEELRLTAVELEHVQSGARALHLACDDAENLFSIAFPTPPPDDTGVPHIVEHAVLSGSARFPVRDPFFEMLKMSMATFLNAMTGWDCTYYPVASNVKADLFNLAEVYFDAVFHPLLTERIFKREGRHLAPADPADPTGDLTVSGIVFNEMKGVFSNPEARLYRSCSRSLLPDTPYGRESGGDPEHIPDLTYEDFRKFYDAFYRPSNAHFVLYGNIPTAEYLAFLAERLGPFDKTDALPPVGRQPRWSAPRREEDTYPVAAAESDSEKTYIAMNWLVGDATDPGELARLYVMNQILLGNEAAPLRKAIVDSGLGQDLVYAGLAGIGLEAAFHVGIKGSEPDRTEAFETLVTDTLRRVSDDGIPADRVDAALQQTLYHYREIGRQFPLQIMDRVLSAWIYGADSLVFLRMNLHLEAMRREYAENPDLFARLIRERILDNPHRLTVVLRPDREWQQRTDAAFAERMKRERSKYDEAALRAIATEAADLEEEAARPNPPEAVAKLPQLKLSDLPARPLAIPTKVEDIGGVEFLRNDVFSNGVNYLHLDFDLRGLSEDLWMALPRYEDAMRQMGAAGMDYEAVARRISAATGGIACRPYFETHAAEPGRSLHHLRISLKALDDRVEPALNVLSDVVFSTDPRDRARLRDVLVQARAHYRTDLLHDGRGTAVRHARRAMDLQGRLAEIVNGLPQLRSTEELTADFDAAHEELMARIEAVRDSLLSGNRLTVSFTGSDGTADRVRARLRQWVGRIRKETVAKAHGPFAAGNAASREGLAGPMQVAFCAKVIPAPHYSHPDEPLVALAAHLITFEYLLPEVRFKGNAYGAGCSYSALNAALSLTSYRDPHVARTLRVFDDLADYIRQAPWTQTDVERAVIGVAKNDERPIRPEDATGLALHRHLTGQTEERRCRRREALLSAKLDDVKRAILETLAAAEGQSPVCVVSSREKLEAANRELGDAPLAIEDVLK